MNTESRDTKEEVEEISTKSRKIQKVTLDNNHTRVSMGDGYCPGKPKVHPPTTELVPLISLSEKEEEEGKTEEDEEEEGKKK